MEEFKVLGEDCQVVVRTASGGNYVKAGVDIGNRSSLNRGEGARSLETIHTLLLTLVSFPSHRTVVVNITKRFSISLAIRRNIYIYICKLIVVEHDRLNIRV